MDPPDEDVSMSVLGRLSAVTERWRRSRDAVDPTLPAPAAVVSLQHPSAALPERPFDVWLLLAVLGLLTIGTIAIYSATAGDGLTQHQDVFYFLERQMMFVGIGGVAMWFAATFDYRRLRQI